MQIASSLNTPHLPTRKILLDVLCFLDYYQDGQVHHLVIAALEALSAANNEGGNPYAYWFKSLETALSGRGKMGTLVGASDDVRRHGGVDTSLNDYTVGGSIVSQCTSSYRIPAVKSHPRERAHDERRRPRAAGAPPVADGRGGAPEHHRAVPFIRRAGDREAPEDPTTDHR